METVGSTVTKIDKRSTSINGFTENVGHENDGLMSAPNHCTTVKLNDHKNNMRITQAQTYNAFLARTETIDNIASSSAMAESARDACCTSFSLDVERYG